MTVVQPELYPDLPPIPEKIAGDPHHRTVTLHTDDQTGVDCLSSFGGSIEIVIDALRDAGAAAAAAGTTWMRVHGLAPAGPEVVQVAGMWQSLAEDLRGLGWTILAPGETSDGPQAAVRVAPAPREPKPLQPGSQAHRLLLAYGAVGDHGHTDEEAAEYAGLLGGCYWKRCGELRRDGLIADTGTLRVGSARQARMVCVITDAGTAEVARLSRSDEDG